MPFSTVVAQNHRAWKASLRAKIMPVAVLVSLVSCEVLGPSAPLPHNAVALVAPPEYEGWWAQTEACSGRRGNLKDIRWFVVPGVATFMTREGLKVGRWSRGGDGTEIVLAGDYVSDELVVRHEMLHALLDREDHPPEYFTDRCHLTWLSWGG